MTGAAAKRAKRDKQTIQADTRDPIRDTPVTAQQGPNAYDGPSDPGRGRGPGSAGGPPSPARGRTPPNAPPSARAPSVHSSRPSSTTRPVLRDPARDPPVINRNVDWAGNAYNLYSQHFAFALLLLSFSEMASDPKMRSDPRMRSDPKPKTDPFYLKTADGTPIVPLRQKVSDNNPFSAQMPTSLMRRPKFNTAGKATPISINSHRVLNFPKKPVYQYDVQIGNGAEKRALIKAVWNSQTLKGELGGGWLFDGNKLAWAQRDLGNDVFSRMIDLDAERGITPRDGHTNSHRVKLRRTGIINMQILQSYLDGKCEFDTKILEAINFLDHLLRETPSANLINIKRSYFARNTTKDRALLGGAVEAMKGVYQSIRAAQCKTLVVNVDVSNSTFWHESSFLQLGYQMTQCDSYLDMLAKIRPIQSLHGQWRDSPQFVQLKRLAKNEFRVTHRGCTNPTKIWKCHRMSDKTSNTYKFDLRDRTTNTVTPNTSVYDYYMKRYDIALEWPDLPVVETTKKGVVYPMELCLMAPSQRYPYKLDEKQTAAMIKFAVTKPEQRKQTIQDGLDLLDWKNDKFLINYGLNIDPNMLKTEARILKPPEVLYGKNMTAAPGFSGRWDLRGKVFLKPNSAPLKSWGVCVVGSGQQRPALQAFITSFISVYRGHGGIVENATPFILTGVADIAKAVDGTFQGAGNAAKLRPQILIFILPNRSAEVYKRIKKNCECRFGVMSQCIQGSNVLKNQAQYHSNVCMKFNAKLGGTTCRVKLASTTGHFKTPTMIIGADVSHAAPGSQQPSMAAMTVSMDTTATRYAAAVETNGHRVEMIATRNLEDMLRPLFTEWAQTVGQGRMPKHIYYFRDGVSEGQYQAVLKAEVADIKRMVYEMSATNPNYECKFTVVVAEKRHHIRFFPPRGMASDKNNNPVPGTLVEKDVTHVNEYDFYLCSHAAIQGTARPTHYHVLLDDANMEPNEFQAMLYEHSYQYMRATTPVSLFPAVYYAHLASNRGAAHENKSQDAILKEKSTPSSDPPETETPPLMPMLNATGIRYGMWYI